MDTVTSDPAVNEVAVQAPPAPVAPDKRSRPELLGHVYAHKLIEYFEREKVQYMRDDAGRMSIILHGKQIPLLAGDVGFAKVMLGVCNVSTTSAESRVAIERLIVYAGDQASQMQSRSFSAVIMDDAGRRRVYVPTKSGGLLEIGKDGVFCVTNGTNRDRLWVTHPKGEPFNYLKVDDPREGLADFERLLVDTQACQHPPMKWLVGMHEGFFPFVRDLAGARFIAEHVGPTQNGKTTGAERFTRLLGLGKVKGDATVASLANESDPGLQVLDNKEQANFNQQLIDYCLFLATGGERGRSNSDGSTRASRKTQPAAVITSIEGVFKAELQARYVEIAYKVSGPKVDRERIEEDIITRRHVILSAMMHVLQRFLSMREQRIPTPNPFGGNFGVHFTALCDLLRAFGQLAAKSDGWAETIIMEWDRIIRRKFEEEGDENALEFHIREIVKARSFLGPTLEAKEIAYDGRQGTLYITTPAYVLAKLNEKPHLQRSLPKDPAGLSRRLSSERFHSFVFLRDEGNEAPGAPPLPPELKRKNNKRTIGFFFPADASSAQPTESAGLEAAA